MTAPKTSRDHRREAAGLLDVVDLLLPAAAGEGTEGGASDEGGDKPVCIDRDRTEIRDMGEGQHGWAGELVGAPASTPRNPSKAPPPAPTTPPTTTPSRRPMSSGASWSRPAAAAMPARARMTTGRAIPSLSPLLDVEGLPDSTRHPSVRHDRRAEGRVSRGESGTHEKGKPRTHSQHDNGGNSAQRNGQGSPRASSRRYIPRSARRSAIRTRLASANNTQTRVTSATTLITCGSDSSPVRFRTCVMITPVATKKIGVEIATARAENVPHTKIAARIRHNAPRSTAQLLSDPQRFASSYSRQPSITEMGEIEVPPDMSEWRYHHDQTGEQSKKGPGRRRSSWATLSSAEPAARAAALVVVITISRVLAVSPLAIGPAGWRKGRTGLTSAGTLAAIRSGTLRIAPGRPARRSFGHLPVVAATRSTRPSPLRESVPIAASQASTVPEPDVRTCQGRLTDPRRPSRILTGVHARPPVTHRLQCRLVGTSEASRKDVSRRRLEGCAADGTGTASSADPRTSAVLTRFG